MQTNGTRIAQSGAALASNEAGFSVLAELLAGSGHAVVLSGAGCSTASGIPDYRDKYGRWKRPQPVQFRDFVRDPATRQRYWARSFAGWERIYTARPNRAHRALAKMENDGRLAHLITQNVDGLHQSAGSANVTDLHGRLDTVVCIACGEDQNRAEFQTRLQAANSDWRPVTATIAPDGDADIDASGCSGFVVPSCESCGGIVKPSVVFFGESVPRERVERAWAEVNRADLLLVAGSSLMVFSGYRFARGAAERGVPVAAVNIGRTRADDLLTVKIQADCGLVFEALSGQATIKNA